MTIFVFVFLLRVIYEPIICKEQVRAFQNICTGSIIYLCLIQIKFNSNTHMSLVGAHMVGLLMWSFVVAKEPLLVSVMTQSLVVLTQVQKWSPLFTLAFIPAGWKLPHNPMAQCVT